MQRNSQQENRDRVVAGKHLWALDLNSGKKTLLGGALMGGREEELPSQQKQVFSEALYKRMSCNGLGREWGNPGLEGHIDPHLTVRGGGRKYSQGPRDLTS